MKLQFPEILSVENEVSVKKEYSWNDRNHTYILE